MFLGLRSGAGIDAWHGSRGGAERLCAKPGVENERRETIRKK